MSATSRMLVSLCGVHVGVATWIVLGNSAWMALGFAAVFAVAAAISVAYDLGRTRAEGRVSP